MKKFLLHFFTWWHDETIGTRFWTWRKGVFVGKDESGNMYYRQRKGDRRWVLYNGDVEATRIPAAWHGWMHHTSDAVPGEVPAHAWEKPHLPNLTGTPGAYRPPGSILHANPRTPAPPDYEAWTPEG